MKKYGLSDLYGFYMDCGTLGNTAKLELNFNAVRVSLT
jgi:hypothetical protein